MITYQIESFRTLAKEAQELFKNHSAESSERTDVIPLDINYRAYFKLEDLGKLETHTVRDDGKLIGYSAWMFMNPLHYKNSLTASSTILYIIPEYRKGLLGYKFIKWSIDQIKKHNVQRILIGIKPHHDFGKLLERLGANYFEKVYSIVLD